MPGARRRDLVRRRRRRTADDGDDDASVATEHVDDTASEASVASDADADAEADDTDISESARGQARTKASTKSNSNGVSKPSQEKETVNSGAAVKKTAGSTAFVPSQETDMMLNGMKVPDSVVNDAGVEFDAVDSNGQTGSNQPVIVTSTRPEPPADKRRREAEEYRKKREADPAFIPNRGEFFMHDHRAHAGQNGLGFAGRGRGRGRGGLGRPFGPPSLPVQANEPMNSPWTHDLHHTLAELEQQKPRPYHDRARPVLPALVNVSAMPASRPAGSTAQTTAPVTFNTTKVIGKVVIRAFLPGMKTAKTFPDFEIHMYARLPNHRPPLRRDKPVRISLPDNSPKFVFPSVERSFIFIPRALRPNQQGFGARRGRGYGSMGGFSSRRTSAYGGSVYSPSVAASRRSSLARDVARDGLISPTGSVVSRAPGPVDASKPIVRLPVPTAAAINAVQNPQISANGHPVVSLPQPTTYPLPQRPAFQASSTLPMHQPRPQKTVSVAGIEHPADTFAAPQQQEQQPFHQQVPAHMNGPATMTDGGQYAPHVRQPSYPSQPSTGTPLSHIPERAIHAQPFQPYQQGGFPAPAFQPGAYYYPPPGSAAMPFAPVMPMPVYVQSGQPGSFVPQPISAAVPMPVVPTSQAQPGMVAHEANGTVYYYDQSSMYAPPAMDGYAAPSYAVPGMGGMMTPSPDTYYYPQMPSNGTVYYTQQPQ